MFRDLERPMFWEQSARLVEGERVWEVFRKNGRKVAMLFWQQSIGEQADMIISPAPVHKHGGGMIQSCYSKPADLYEKLCRGVGKAFDLKHYWGPLASRKSSDWIAQATACLLGTPDAPDLCFTYLPVLDYDLQRYGPGSPQARKALDAFSDQLALLISAAERHDYHVLVFGDYGIEPVSEAVPPNLALRETGMAQFRSIRGMLYPDYSASRAFAVADHQVAHVYVRDDTDISAVAGILAALPGVDATMDRGAREEAGINHRRSGDLVLVAGNDRWFAYPWWQDKREAPDYASHVDIHNKPGYDPCELFFGWPPIGVSMNTGRVRGSHGARTAGSACWASTLDLEPSPCTQVELALAVRTWLGGQG